MGEYRHVTTKEQNVPKTKSKLRLYSKREPRLPVPSYRKKVKESFALKTLDSADRRFAIVKELRARLVQLKDDCGCDTLQKEFLCSRAIFLVARCEALEFDCVTGKEIQWREYLMVCRALSDVLKAIGLDRERKTAKRLETYLMEARTQNGKHKVRS
jgi:hypothetical protein